MPIQKVKFSRHTRSRMRLYDISEDDVKKTIAKPDKGPLIEGGKYIVLRAFREKFKGFPLKVIYVLENDFIVVISVYPLKKSYRK